jgi:ferritin
MRQLISEEEITIVNALGHQELMASQAYLHLSIMMKNLGFFGAEKFFMEESISEREHFGTLNNFMNNMGEAISVMAIDAQSFDVDSLMDALEYAYDMEADLLQKYESAYESVSPKLKALIYDFLKIQTKSVGEYGDLIARLGLTNEPILIDQELGK